METEDTADHTGLGRMSIRSHSWKQTIPISPQIGVVTSSRSNLLVSCARHGKARHLRRLAHLVGALEGAETRLNPSQVVSMASRAGRDWQRAYGRTAWKQALWPCYGVEGFEMKKIYCS